MSDNNQNSYPQQKPLSRLSLSNTAGSRSQINASRSVTVEVKRKKVSLLDKRQALQSSALDQDSTNTTQALAGNLTSKELDTRLQAVKKAATEQEQISQDAMNQQNNFVSPVEKPIFESKQEEKMIVNEPVAEEVLEEALVVEEKNKELFQEDPSKKLVNKRKNIPEKKQVEAPVIPVILRAASYGPSQKQLAKEKELARKKADEAVAARKLSEKGNRAKEADSETPIVPFSEPFTSDGKTTFQGRKTKHITEDFDNSDSANKRGGRRTPVGMQRKLTRHVLTRVLEDEEEERSRSVAAYRRAQRKRFLANANKSQVIAKVIRDVIIPDAITVGELASRMAVGSGEVIKSLMKLGTLASINQVIDGDTAELLCVEFGHRAKRVLDSDIEIGIERPLDKSEDLQPRPPVITVMGHVDHGKTSLLDALRKTDVVSTEFGGITQHIGAYQIVTPYSDAKITFLDTPGHAAFSAMRARGANITDIVVIVVAADDGVNEQTIEAISHAKAANALIIVAINKIDKNTADVQRVRNELLAHEVLLEEFGGDVMAVEVSAKKGTNLDKLVEAILLQTDMMELTSNPKGFAEGVVIEASVDKGRGIVATILVQHGTLRPGDIFVAGSEYGRVKKMVDSRGMNVSEALPSCPVEILGFNGAPMAGDKFCVVETEQQAKEVAEYRYQVYREKEALARNQNSIAHMMDKIAIGEIKELSIVLKADVQGSLEAISASIRKLLVNGVRAQIIHSAIGNINETDILLAKASNAIVLGFEVKATPQARVLAGIEGIVVDHYSIIYELLARVESLMKGLLGPKFEEKILGRAEVRVVFSKGKVTKIAGCYALTGLIRRSNSKVRLHRGQEVIFTGKIDTMKHLQDDIKECREAHDCGIILEGFNDIKEGDIIECFEMVEVAKE